MPTAPSFQNYTFLNEPFSKNGKMYITVRNPKTNHERDVRWYSDEEYSKQYAVKDATPNYNKAFKGLKQARGFSNGPITVIRGNKNEDEDWLRMSVARYAMGIGWYFASTDAIPDDTPAHFKLIPLTWKEFRNGDDEHQKSPDQLKEIIKQKEKNLDV